MLQRLRQIAFSQSSFLPIVQPLIAIDRNVQSILVENARSKHMRTIINDVNQV